MEGGGVSCLAWGVGIDCWTVFSILRGRGCVGAMELLGISSYGTYGVSSFRMTLLERILLSDEFSGKLSPPGDALVKVLVAG